MLNVPSILVFGLVSGSVIALGSLGLSLVFRQFRFLNFAYGEFLTLGAYLYVTAGIAWPARSMMLAAALVALVGVLVYLVALKGLVTHGLVILTVASMGIGFAMQNAMISVWGTHVRRVVIPTIPLEIGRLSSLHVTIVIVVLSIATGIAILLYRTRVGLKLRAAADNRELANISGVSLPRVAWLTWGLGGAIAGIAGILLGAYGDLTPTMGFRTLFPVIAAVLIGNGHPFGSALGGLIIGIGTEYGAFYVGSAYKPAMAIGVLALALGLKIGTPTLKGLSE